MSKKRIVAYALCQVVLLSAISLCAFTTSARYIDKAPVSLPLPDRLGDYTGEDVLFCQNPDCLQSFYVSDLTNSAVCPKCGGRLDQVSLPEHRLLPHDTEIIHRSYRGPSGRIYMVSVVVTGHERRGIHKPQVCLVGQGNVITEQYPLEIELPHNESFEVMLMNLNRGRLFFTYWFTDGKHETARHIDRLLRIAVDGIVHNERRRWAYISVGLQNQGISSPLSELKQFAALLHAALRVDRRALPLPQENEKP